MPRRDPVDAVVVGAGPAGSAAALALARAGRSVVLLERGPFPGSKNMYGGVVYGRILDDADPATGGRRCRSSAGWSAARTMVMTATQALTVDYRTEAWGGPPYNGMTTSTAPTSTAGWRTRRWRPGPTLVTSTVATGLLRECAGGEVDRGAHRPSRRRHRRARS